MTMQFTPRRLLFSLILAVNTCLLLSSCSAVKPRASVDAGSADATEVKDGRLTQCTHELEVLKVLDADKFQQYNAELSSLTLSSRQYLTIKDGLSSDVNEIVMPKFQYHLAKLCFNVKTSLTTALIEQVGRDAKP